MNADRWIAIAAIIVSLLTAAWQVKTARQLANPATKPPPIFKSALHRMKFLVKRYWAPSLALTGTVSVIALELSQEGPLDKLSLAVSLLGAISLGFQLSVLMTLRLIYLHTQTRHEPKEPKS